MTHSTALSVTLVAIGIASLSSAQAADTATQPIVAHFHHVQLNTTDPEAAIKFYTTKFKAMRANFAGLGDAVWTGDSWLLFNKVKAPPPSATISGIWHIGWGAEDMKATYQKQLDSGTRFQTPLTDISGMTGAPENSGRFFFAYVDGPDHALIEMNTSRNHNFGHVHMFSADPIATAQWYEKHFGIKARLQTQARTYRDTQIAPAAFMMFDHVSMIVYPMQYLVTSGYEPFKGHTQLAPTRGRVIDHLGFSVNDLNAALAQLKADGVTITDVPHTIGPIKYAFIQGPDQVSIELIEDHSPQPASLAE